jgi:nucleoid-associated protein YgaU
MKINFISIVKLMIILFVSTLIYSCEEKAPEPAEKKDQPAEKIAKPSADSAKPKVIYKTPPKAAPKKAPETKIYTVKTGEWLWDIARKEYGTAIGWFRIYEANRAKIKNPDLIYPGQQFIIPEFKRSK